MDKLGLIILAGGLSTRMGQPKALLPWINGESLISHALRKGLDADIQDILISIGDDEQLGLAIQTHIIDTLSNDEKNKVSIVRDSVGRCGPLGGLYSTLAVGTSSAYAVMAVDMPFMEMDLYYDWLYQVEHNDWNVIVPYSESGKSEPMAGIYRPYIASLIQSILVGENVSLHHALDVIGHVESIDATDFSWELSNINRFEDYQWARALAENEFRRVPLISVVASKRKTGKTTVVTRLVSELQKSVYPLVLSKAINMAFRWIMREQIQILFIKLGLMRLLLQGLLKQRFVYVRKNNPTCMKYHSLCL